MNKKELIEDLVLHYNEITTSDLQRGCYGVG